MFDKIEQFVNDPETRLIAKQAAIAAVVGLGVTIAFNVLLVGASMAAGAAVEAVANAAAARNE